VTRCDQDLILYLTTVRSKASTSKSSPCVTETFSYSSSAEQRTTATASFSKASPRMRPLRVWSTCMSWKMASTVTGSVAEMTAPKYMESKNLIWMLRSMTRPARYIKPPTTKVDTVVPTSAKSKMAPKLAKKCFLRKMEQAGQGGLWNRGNM